MAVMAPIARVARANSRRSPEGEQQSRITASPALVDVHELRLEVGELVDALHLEIREPGRGLLQGALGLGRRCLGLFQLLDLDVAIDLALAKIADEGPGLRGQPFSLALQRAKAVADSVRVATLLSPSGKG